MSSTALASAGNNRSQIQYWGSIYNESFFPVVPLFFQSKHPIPDPKTHSWWPIADPNELQLITQSYPRINLALQFTPDCKAVAVEADSPTNAEYARTLGCSTSDACWIRRSKRGDALIYRKPRDFDLLTFRREGYPLEFISSGLLVVPPSVHPTGFRYRWIRGPEQLSILDLDEPPPALLQEWKHLGRLPRARGTKTVVLAPAIQEHLRELLLQYLPNDRHTLYNPRTNRITSYTDLSSKQKSHISVDLTRGVYFDFHSGQGGPVADLLEKLGCHGAPRIYPRGSRMGIEVPL